MPLSNLNAYRIGCRLRIALPGTFRGNSRRILSAIRHPSYIPQWLTPIAFVRYREFQYAFNWAQRSTYLPQRVLDISSPKLFPITLAKAWTDCRVDAIDLVEPDLLELRHAQENFKLRNLFPAKQDARSLDFEDDLFDLVTSISVFEHIAPEDNGELPAVQELYRVLKPGGVAILIVPFANEYFAEYANGPVYERTESPTNQQTFYQRFYDMDRLNNSIIVPSRLELVDLSFISERHPSTSSRKRYASKIAMEHQHTTRYGLLYPLLAKLLLSSPKPLERCRKPYIACMTLRKPTGTTSKTGERLQTKVRSS